MGVAGLSLVALILCGVVSDSSVMGPLLLVDWIFLMIVVTLVLLCLIIEILLSKLFAIES